MALGLLLSEMEVSMVRVALVTFGVVVLICREIKRRACAGMGSAQRYVVGISAVALLEIMGMYFASVVSRGCQK